MEKLLPRRRVRKPWPSLLITPRPATSWLASKKISEISTEKVQHTEGKMDYTSESNPTNEKPISDAIMPHLLNMYGSCATASDFEIYDVNASFEDPLVSARGVKQIKSSFYSLSKFFGESKIVEYSVTEKPISAAGIQEILIDNKQQYKFMGRNIDMISLITLHVKDGKVIRHEDWWDKKPLRNRETVKFPCVGRLIELTRRGSMLATHALMGFGKDPSG